MKFAASKTGENSDETWQKNGGMGEAIEAH